MPMPHPNRQAFFFPMRSLGSTPINLISRKVNPPRELIGIRLLFATIVSKQEYEAHGWRKD